ncbi:MAG: D-alanyl-D-alanine carboxypeptidase family protein, partial [Xanthomonadaceae bacterium]|nr:D-alanyl-D-alanine carboxypeptidase family protein [Xanthomonadaceae bacterium]
MEITTSIRPVRLGEVEKLVALIRARLPDVVHAGPAPDLLERRLVALIEDGCLIAAIKSGEYAGVLALDLYDRQVIACYLNPTLASAGTPRKLFAAVEQRALAYGLRSLQCCILAPALSLMWQMEYSPTEPEPDTEQPILVRKDLRRRADEWIQDVFSLQDELGIPQDYGPRHHLEMVHECDQRISIGFDAYDREQWLTPEAAEAWKTMESAANGNGVRLQVVSAYRGLHYQAGIIRAKLEQGQTLARILSVSAAPGFSEHHSGRALDLKTPAE